MNYEQQIQQLKQNVASMLQCPLILRDERIETVPADLAREEDSRKDVRGMQCVFHAAGAASAVGIRAAVQQHLAQAGVA